uniref:SEFIR domain-containing protein n=1 Tax=Candidatus Kentrum sp. DK TaxID=2126562 RepID=A0A450S6E5_9GAMM|nr:MAG: SEFIR domain-containing protein [Candidatus Kentron sp. DK]
MKLATELRESGVDAVLDKWDLKEGHDAVAFMEKMVTDPEIKKVLMICDQTYAEKANGRAGGVGTETQIISAEVYAEQAQEKFVAIVREKDEEGKPCVPTYYKSRIHIDFSEEDQYAESFEQLLRWIFDKPLHKKPEIGSSPAFLSEEASVSLGTTPIFRRCIDALKNHRPRAFGAFDEYCETFTVNLERFRLLDADMEGELDDAVIENIGEFLPARNEAIQLFVAIARYSEDEGFIERLHRFFEGLIPFMYGSIENPQTDTRSRENYQFIVHELFLYALAVLLKNERFRQANHLLQQRYHWPENATRGREVMVDFAVFRNYMKSLERREQRLKLSRISLRADLLHDRCVGTGLDFRHLMQADFVAFLRADIEAKDNFSRWWPETLVYIERYDSSFEIFARSESKAYFDKVKVLLGIETPKEIEPLLESYRNGSRKLPQWEYGFSFDPVVLLGYKQLATRP